MKYYRAKDDAVDYKTKHCLIKGIIKMLKEFYINAQRFLALFYEEFADYSIYCDYNGNFELLINMLKTLLKQK